MKDETIREWRTWHDIAGVESPERSKHHKFYSAGLKHAAVKDFFSGRYSQREIPRNYQIPTDLFFKIRHSAMIHLLVKLYIIRNYCSDIKSLIHSL